MSARTDRGALSARLREFQVVLSCLTPGVARLSSQGRRLTPSLEIWVSVKLAHLAVPTAISVRQFVLPVAEEGDWETRLAGYEYAVIDDTTEQDLFAYHWHPAGRSHLVAPHLHLGNAPLTALGASRGIHFPTGPLPFCDFVGMLLRECGAKPHRRDWERVLREASV